MGYPELTASIWFSLSRPRRAMAPEIVSRLNAEVRRALHADADVRERVAPRRHRARRSRPPAVRCVRGRGAQALGADRARFRRHCGLILAFDLRIEHADPGTNDQLTRTGRGTLMGGSFGATGSGAAQLGDRGNRTARAVRVQIMARNSWLPRQRWAHRRDRRISARIAACLCGSAGTRSAACAVPTTAGNTTSTASAWICLRSPGNRACGKGIKLSPTRRSSAAMWFGSTWGRPS